MDPELTDEENGGEMGVMRQLRRVMPPSLTKTMPSGGKMMPLCSSCSCLGGGEAEREDKNSN